MLNLTPADVKHELEKLHYDLFLEETEDNWEKTAKAMNAFNKICMDGGYDVAGPEVVNAFRGAHRPIISAMNSERTRLSGCALDLVNSVATAVGKDFEQLLSIFMPPLLALCGRTNKVVTNRARGVIFNVIEVAQLASVLSYFLRDIKDKSISLRQVIAEGTLAVLNSCNPPDLEKEARAKEIEAIIRGTARDANADVRKVSRKIFESYKILLPSRVESFTAPLSPTMKKYLDIKSNTLTTHKSTSNLRSNLNLNPETKPSASTTASTTTITRPNGHARTASASTFNTGTTSAQAKNLATSLTRVSRKEPTTEPSAPVRQVQPSRVVSQSRHETQRAAPSNVGPSRATASQETKRPIPPLRSQRSIISQTTGSSTAAAPIAPRRLQLNPNPPAANAAPLASSGPRRVPMAPPPPPAPKKDEAPKRPASRVDNAASTATTASRTAAPPPAPMKKPASSTTSSLKDRVPSTKPPVPKFKPASSTTSATGAPSASTAENKPTTAKAITKPPVPRYRPTPAAPLEPAAASGTTKPLAMAKAKPIWGSGPSAKPATSQKGASLAKTVVKKASTRTVAKPPVAGAAKNIRRPVTPEMVALPPSPTPEEEKVAPDNNQQVKAKEEKVTVEHVEKQNSPAVSPIPESVFVNDVEVSEQFSEKKEEKGTVEAESASTTLTDDHSTATTSTVTAHIQTAFGSYRMGAAPASITTDSGQPPMRLPTSNADLLLPRTPSNNFLLPNASNPAFATKTPISALLSSIEQGFFYSPVTPLSPPDAYMPGPNGTPSSYCHQRDAPRVEGPMQPFNYALHQHGGAVFGGMFGGKKEAELVRGDIGVVSVNMNDQKMFVPIALPGLDERLGFVDFNQ